MYKTCLLILLMCVVRLVQGETKETPMSWRECYILYQQLGIADAVSYPAFKEALDGYYRYKADGKGMLALIDFTKPSTEKRFCVVDLQQKRVLFESHVAHGRRSGENYADSFSNDPGSYKSSLGFFLTGSTYYGKNGYSLLLDGLEQGINDKARERAIVIHGADYADPTVLREQERLGRSLGCPALPPAISQQVIDTIKNGTLLYIYGQNKAV